MTRTLWVRDWGGSPEWKSGVEVQGAITCASLRQCQWAHTRQFNRVPTGASSERDGLCASEWSRVPRLNVLMTRVITLQIQSLYEINCIVQLIIWRLLRLVSVLSLIFNKVLISTKIH